MVLRHLRNGEFAKSTQTFIYKVHVCINYIEEVPLAYAIQQLDSVQRYRSICLIGGRVTRVSISP